MKKIKIYLGILFAVFISSAILYERGIIGHWAAGALAVFILGGITWVGVKMLKK